MEEQNIPDAFQKLNLNIKKLLEIIGDALNSGEIPVQDFKNGVIHVKHDVSFLYKKSS